MFWGIVIALFLLLIALLLWMPIELCIDTKANNYYIRVKGLVTASIESHRTELLQINLKLPLYSHNFYPLRLSGKKKKKKKPDSPKKKKSRKTMSMRRMLRVIRTFRIKKFKLDLDTGDSMLNAKLYPLSALLNFYYGNIGINFEGRNELALIMQNRPIRIIKSFINF